MTAPWDRQQARRTYAIEHWGEGYFDIDEQGGVIVQPAGPSMAGVRLDAVIDEARRVGMRLPLLLRFTDVLQHRRQHLQQTFAEAMREHDYAGGYTAIYPVKVNQQHGVVSELVAGTGVETFGLEAGSKPELLAVLAMAQPGSLVICNGYKDREYIRLALMGTRMGLRTVIVIEKATELAHIIAEADALQVQPILGVRVRLASLGVGRWQNSGGEKAKFGLTPGQLLKLIERLRVSKLTESLRLLHFHMGSQMSNLRDIAGGMREAVRFMVELARLGISLDYVDVGGGLGVDYQGTGSRDYCSLNYSLEQYASSIVQPLAEVCATHGLASPRVLTEAGRAMTAHHAVLVAEVTDCEVTSSGAWPAEETTEPTVLQHMRVLHRDIERRPPTELYLEAQQYLAEGRSLFVLGHINIAQRAALDDLYYLVLHALKTRLNPSERSHRQTLDELDARLVDKYFLNFSIFESLPDVWAIQQIFPILPIAGLDRKPQRQGVIVDLTCDSDGRVDQYVTATGLAMSLPLHALEPGKAYRLGIFLVGAYQETLGDIHNLFGDTDAVNVRVTGEGFELSHLRHGDSASLMLDYVGYDLDTLRAAWQEKMTRMHLATADAERFTASLEAGLQGYTYLGGA